MESKIIKLLLVALLFFAGVFLGENFSGNNSDLLLEAEREQFENEITTPGNDYKGKFPDINQGPRPNVTTNIAQKIDQGIITVVDKFFSSIASLLNADEG